jgi:hypothetical protein
MDEPTDRDLVTDHPFRPHPLHPDVCGYQRRDGWAGGFSRAEHADQGPP